MGIDLLKPSRLPLWLRSKRDQRLAKHRELVKGIPPVACTTDEDKQARQDMEATMKEWTHEQWRAYDAPWGSLLKEWLNDPVLDQAGLYDFQTHHQQAWWPIRLVRPDDLTTSVTEQVWKMVTANPPPTLPTPLLNIARLSSGDFYHKVIEYTLKHPRPDLAEAVCDAFSMEHAAEPILKSFPEALPEQINLIWKRMSWCYMGGRFLKGVMASSQPHAEALLVELSRQGEKRNARCHDERPEDHEAWHAGFIEALNSVLQGEHEDRLGPWAKHFTWADQPKLRFGLRNLFYLAEAEDRERQMVRRLDKLTTRLEPLIPITQWKDPNFWPERTLGWMPETCHRLLLLDRQDALARQVSEKPSPARLRRRS